jgi:hypothetical protein
MLKELKDLVEILRTADREDLIGACIVTLVIVALCML